MKLNKKKSFKKKKAQNQLPELELTQKFKSVWNPRLIDEPESNYIDAKKLFETAEMMQNTTFGGGSGEGNVNAEGVNEGQDLNEGIIGRNYKNIFFVFNY